jgi:membrane-associated HD superfamily phosphohydrolase
MFGIYVIRKSNDNYMEINDSAYPLLVKLRETNKDEYFRAVHTAYLAERIALALGLNDRAVKNVSYYHRIGVLEEKQSWDDVKHIYIENNFPHEAVDFLQEYIEAPVGKVRSCECFAVYISETVITAINYLIKKDKEAKIDYDKLIDKIFDEKEAKGQLMDYNVTYRQNDQMKKILKKEKLYYDFLR